jgi:uncharacterized membrane-anchored protein YitT (DUF2179 family)
MDLRRSMTWWDGVKILAGTALTSFAFRFFTFPNHIVSGGVTGIAQIVNMLTGFPVGVFTILMNIPLFLLAWKKLGRRFVVLTAVCMGLSSVSIDLLEKVARPLTEDPMLAAVYGGVIKGAGFGLIYTTGATTGGADIPARMLRRKYPHINFGTFSLGINAVIILSFAVIFRRFDSSMYTLICMYISSKVISLILYGPIDSRLCYIISDRSDEVRSAITGRLGRGATMLQGHGAWSGKEEQVILCVVKPPQLARLRALVREIDESAFLVVSDARSVYGKGFESIMQED